MAYKEGGLKDIKDILKGELFFDGTDVVKCGNKIDTDCGFRIIGQYINRSGLFNKTFTSISTIRLAVEETVEIND